MNGEVDVKTLTLDQLKALAYDEIQKLEFARQNLQIINTEIGSRKGVPSEPVQPAEATAK